MARLYVGNIPYTATDLDIRAAFSPFGNVSKVDIVIDRETSRPRGFAFVTMDDAGAPAAIAQLAGTDFGGRSMVVNVAKERSHREGARQNSGW
jgi:RNA recognition motif-containing protein